MCDYSLEAYQSRPAINDEQYTLHRFRSGTLGFVVETDCTTAVCMPAGARLRLEGLDDRLQRSLRLSSTEEVVMIRLQFRDNMHRDGVRFSNGREVLLQCLNAGLSARLVTRDLSAIFDLRGIMAREPVDTAPIAPALDFAPAPTSPPGSPLRIGRIGQHCIRIARTFRQLAWQRYSASGECSNKIDA